MYVKRWNKSKNWSWFHQMEWLLHYLVANQYTIKIFELYLVFTKLKSILETIIINYIQKHTTQKQSDGENMEIIGNNKDDETLIDFTVNEDELKVLQDGFEFEKQRRDAKYTFEDFCGEIIMISTYEKKINILEQEFHEKMDELKEIQKELDESIDKQLDLMKKIDDTRKH